MQCLARAEGVAQSYADLTGPRSRHSVITARRYREGAVNIVQGINPPKLNLLVEHVLGEEAQIPDALFSRNTGKEIEDRIGWCWLEYACCGEVPVVGVIALIVKIEAEITCLLYTSPSPRDRTRSRMPSSA